MRLPINKLAPIQFSHMAENQPIRLAHSHSEYEILYFHRVESKYKLGNRTLELESGDLLLMNGIVLHGPLTNAGNGYCRTGIHFDPAYVNELSRFPYSLKILQPFLRFENIKVTLREENKLRFERMLAEMSRLHGNSDFIAQLRFQALFLDLLIFISDLCDGSEGIAEHKQTIVRTAKERHFRELFRYLENHYTREIHLRGLEEQMHVNKYHLSKLFKEMTGMTIFQYVMLKRIHQAKARLLLRPSQSISEIGIEVGFKQLAHFTRAFKQFTGSTPERFRKNSGSYQQRVKESHPGFDHPELKPPIRIRYSQDNPVAMGPHLHSTYEIYFFLEGRCSYIVGDDRYALQPGDMLIMDGSTPHGANPDRNFPYRRTAVHFDPDYAKRLGSSFGIDLLKPFRNGTHSLLRLSAPEQHAYEEKLNTLENLYAQNNEVACNRLHALFLDLLLMINDTCSISLKEKDSGSRYANEKIVQDIIRYIELHYREEFRLEALSKALHLSKNHISRIFRETTGIRITEFLNRRRINQAMTMLQSKYKRRTIDTIGLEIGFKNHGHFSRVFKSYTGYTPQQFKLLYIRNPVEPGPDPEPGKV